MNYCENCLHFNICGSESCADEGLTFCNDKIEENNLYINRQDVFNAIENLGWYSINHDRKVINVSELIQAVDNMPVVVLELQKKYKRKSED